MCIECSGIHRDMGVHISRIRSIELDKLGTVELLVSLFILSLIIFAPLIRRLMKSTQSMKRFYPMQSLFTFVVGLLPSQHQETWLQKLF